MLKYKNRFHRRNHLSRVYRKGSVARGESISLRFVKNSNRDGNSRSTVVVSRKTLKSAPKRNRVRRRIYEILRISWDNIQNNFDFIITVHDPKVIDMTHENLKNTIINQLKRASIWKDR